jgi:hypothetical protein
MLSRENTGQEKLKHIPQGNQESVDKMGEWVQYFPKESLIDQETCEERTLGYPLKVSL